MPLNTTHPTDQKHLSKMIQIIMLGLSATASNSLLHAADEIPQNNAKTQVLPALNFTANQLGEITENSGVYTPGTIATATRLVLK